MTKLDKTALDERLDEIAWDIGRAYGKDIPFPIHGRLKNLLRRYTESIVPEKRELAPNGYSERVGFNEAIDTIKQNASELLGDTK